MNAGSGYRVSNGDENHPAARAVLLFDSTHDAMKAENAIITAGFWCDVVPRPPDTSSELCGLAIEVQMRDRDEVGALLSGATIKYSIHQAGDHER